MENTERVPEKSICESCGKEFSCGANVGKCWCFAVEVKAETLVKLREDFQSCLCKNCLNKYESEQDTLGINMKADNFVKWEKTRAKGK